MTARPVACALAVLCLAALLPAASATAQEVWVRDEVRLNLRTGPGSQYRITGAIATGDSVRVTDRAEGWTKVRMANGREGWVPAGFLDEEPPAAVRVDRMEGETRELREAVSALREEVEALRTERDALAESEGTLRARAEALEAENLKLEAGARWPEWITGAAILATGMLVGSILQSWMSRRPRSRIKL